MKLIRRNKSNSDVTVGILHQKPNNKNVKFLNVYHIKNDPKIDMKSTMTKAFKKAHPDWHISKIDLRKEK